MTEGRAQISDEDWVQLGAETDDNAYYDAFEKIFGLDLRTDG
jgi:hypothetical protein